MVTREQAQTIASSWIAALSGDDDSCVIVDSQTIERASGWIFFYQARRYLETHDPSDALAGNAPIIVNRQTGQVTETGTAHPTEYYLARYEASLSPGAA